MSRADRFTGVIDCSVWSGNWPFLDLPLANQLLLRQRLEGLGVERALISPTRAILDQDTHGQSRRFLEQFGDDGFFVPVPVLNPRLDDWQEALDFFQQDSRVKVIRLIPNYHLYTPDSLVLGPLIRRLSRRIVLAVQMRVEDERGRFPPLQIHDVEALPLARCCSEFPDQPFLIHNAYLRDVPELMLSAGNTWLDIASLEVQDILTVLQERYGLERFVYASHAPFYYPEGNIAKLRADLPETEISAVARGNAARLLEL